MALGGGSFTVQNKTLPGAYINFISKSAATASLSDRGIVTMPLELDWGPEGKIFEVTNADFQKNSLKIFGHAYTDDAMKGLRDLFANAQTLYAYRLNGGAAKATNDFATALYGGTRGNDLKIVIQKNADNAELFDVETYLTTPGNGAAVGDAAAGSARAADVTNAQVDLQTVKTAAELVANDFVTFKADATLAVTAASPLEGGANATVSGSAYQAYLDKIESFSFNTMGLVSADETTIALFNAFQKRLRDEMGIKFQLVTYRNEADYFGTISVENKVTDEGWSEASLVYWVTGAEAACAVNRSCQNKRYDGEFTVDTEYTQSQLVEGIKSGKFMLHQVNQDVRVLDDINTLVTTTDTVGDIFKDNQTVRVIDQIGNDVASLFATKYLGVVPNKASGRTSLWSDIVKLCQQLQDVGAIENFEDKQVTVDQGDTKKSVVVTTNIEVVNAMGKLYMTVIVA